MADEHEIARANALIEAHAAQTGPDAFAPAPPFAFDPAAKPVVATYETAGVSGPCGACIGIPGAEHGDAAYAALAAARDDEDVAFREAIRERRRGGENG